MKKFRFVLLAALLLAFSFMGCKLPETTYTYEFGIVDTADAEKFKLPNYVNFDILEETKDNLYYYTYEDSYEKHTELKKEDVIRLLNKYGDSQWTNLVFDSIESVGNWLIMITYTDTDDFKGWMYFEKE